MKDVLRLGCFAAFWGDTKSAIRDILDGSEVDYLVADYLSEITMALLARARAKDPAGGYIADFIATVEPVLAEIADRGIKVVVNAGALNPVACAQALSELAQQQGLSLRVAAIEGDDLLPVRDAVLAASPADMITGQSVPADLGSLNAYLGARPIATALAAGADVVITGRCVDAAVVLGPLMHEFGWKDDEYDLLAAGSLVGHIVECGPQATGGNVTDWADIAGWDRMGYPVAECHPDGTAVITKPDGTGGAVTVSAVVEQILYEIGDPGAYLMPDVVCDWRQATLTQEGPDRVRVAGAKGSVPTTTYKATATRNDGFRVMTTALFAGDAAAAKASKMADAIIARTERLAAAAGRGPVTERSVEVVGSGQLMGRQPDGEATEAVVKIGLRSADRGTLEIFSGEFASMALVAQGMTGFFAGRPRVAPAIAVYHLAVGKASVPVRVLAAGEATTVGIAPGSPDARTGTPPLGETDPQTPSAGQQTPSAGQQTPSACQQTPSAGQETPLAGQQTQRVPLARIATARSGDKGDLANIGLIARRPEYETVLHEQVTAARVGEFFAHLNPGPVTRWALPGLHAINVVIASVLGGTGGTSTLRYDPQGKSYAAMLLTMPVDVPADLLS